MIKKLIRLIKKQLYPSKVKNIKNMIQGNTNKKTKENE